MGSVLVPKGPRAEARGQADGDGLSVEEMRQELFRLPLPPNPTNTRTYPIDTTLGRIMRLRRLSINEVAKVHRGPSARQLGDHLAGRRELSNEHKDALARGLGIDRRLI